jgi:alpha-tubulin suppressor-like RCC1 family protein
MNHFRRFSLVLTFIAALAIIAAVSFLSPLFRATAAPLASGRSVISLWGGARHGIVLLSDGTVWDWGMNWSGMLGDNTVSTFPPATPWENGSNDRHTPLQVHGPGNVGYLTSVKAIMGGESHNFALLSNGTVWAWGWNMMGQLGDGTNNDSAVPVQVSGLTSIISLGGRGYHSLAIQTGGTVWAWGNDNVGQLGDGKTGATSSVPVKVSGLSGVQSVTGGYEHSLALMADHSLQAWGLNSDGELGDGANISHSTPVAVKGISSVTQVSAGWKHTVALTSDKTVWTWGQNANGELGDGATAARNLPYQVPGLAGVIAVSGGDCHTAALKEDGTVWTWGCNDRGQLGDGTTFEHHSPVQVIGLGHVIAITARDYHNLALKDDGTLWAWGWNINGQLGDGTIVTRTSPVKVLLQVKIEFIPIVLK